MSSFRESGYCDCPCRDCFEVAMTDSDGNPQLCWECEEAGCSPEGDDECQVTNNYGKFEKDSTEGEDPNG